MGSIEVQVIRIATPFSTTEQFVGTFKNYVTDDSCFIPSTQMKTVGVETGFSIRLADGTPVLRGLGVVLDAWPTDENPWRKPGIRLGLRKLTKETKSIFDELQHARFARGSRNIIPSGEHAPLVREEPVAAVPSFFEANNLDDARAEDDRPASEQLLNPRQALKRRAESMSDAPAPIESEANTAAPVVISFFDANNNADDADEAAPLTTSRPTRSMRVVETHGVEAQSSVEARDGVVAQTGVEAPQAGAVSASDAWMADSAVPMLITEERESATDRVDMTDIPMRSEVATLLGFAPLAKPERASTERQRDTVLGMAPLAAIDAIENDATSEHGGLTAIGPIAIEQMAVPQSAPQASTLPMPAPWPSALPTMPMTAQDLSMTAQDLPMMAQVVSLPGLAHLWDPPELAALAALETTAIIERPRRRVFAQWIERLVWRVRAWYRTRSMR